MDINERKEIEQKPDCYECKWKRNSSYNCHIQCRHPAYDNVFTDPMSELLGIFASVGRSSPILSPGDKSIEVTGHAHGIRMGWFNHPFNFDPTWLIGCTGFEKKQEE